MRDPFAQTEREIFDIEDPHNYTEQAIARADIDLIRRYANPEMNLVLEGLANGYEMADIAHWLRKDPHTLHNRFLRFRRRVRRMWNQPLNSTSL